MKDGAEAGEEVPAGDGRRARRPPPRRRPPPPPRGVRGLVARAIGLTATLVLLGVGVAVVLTLTRDSDSSAAKETFAPTATATATAAAKRKAKRAMPRLTNAQKASRSAAVGQLRSQGFEPVAISTYNPREPLRVLIGRPKASSTGVRGRRAFFFEREQYLGTDSASPSLRLKVANQKGSQITLAYTRFAAGDKLCCPSDGTVRVRFKLDGERLTPLDPIPPAASRLPPA
jgi:hypothetical protein